MTVIPFQIKDKTDTEMTPQKMVEMLCKDIEENIRQVTRLCADFDGDFHKPTFSVAKAAQDLNELMMKKSFLAMDRLLKGLRDDQ